MGDSWATNPQTRRAMQGNRSRDTAPELAVRRLVHAMGMRYLVNARPVPNIRRTADLVFRGPRVAVFIDGCYWHGCPLHYRQPATHVDFWRDKVTQNQARDADTDTVLRAAGWRVLRFWEHDAPETVAEAIRAAIIENR
ncbi:MAG: very short patch repair endonuclease [Propionicimonas sp.]